MTKPIQRLLHIVKRFQYVLHAVFVLRMRRGHAIEPGLLQSRKCYDPETDWRIVLVKVVVDGMSGWGAKLPPAKLPYFSAARVAT